MMSWFIPDTLNLSKSGWKVMVVPLFSEEAVTWLLMELRLSLQRILILFFPSQVIASKCLLNMDVALLPNPFMPVVFLPSSLKLEPLLGLVNATRGIHSPSGVFSTLMPLPLSDTFTLLESISTDILLAYFPSVLMYSSTELSIISTIMWCRAWE